MGLFDRRKTESTPAAVPAGYASSDNTEIPRYPPFLKGLPVAAPERIVATQQELIVRLQDGLAFTDTRFAALVRPVSSATRPSSTCFRPRRHTTIAVPGACSVTGYPPVLDRLAPIPEVSMQTAGTLAVFGADPDNQRGEAAARATAGLRGRGVGGETLLALAEVLTAAPNTRDRRIRRKDEQVLVLFPDGLTGLGASPRENLEALAGDGLLDVNPLAPLRRVIEVDGEHGTLLNLDASRQMLVLLANTEPALQVPTGQAGSNNTVPNPPEKRSAEPPVSGAAPADGSNRLRVDTDPARALVERIRERDPDLTGGVSQTDGWLGVNREAVRAWAQEQGVQAYVLIRTLGHLPGCRVTPDGGLEVREEP